jgi:hypothetical protein
VYNVPKSTTGGANSDFVVGLFVSGITLKFWEFVYYRRAEEYAWRVPTLNPALAPVKENGAVYSNGHAITNGNTAVNGGAVVNGNGALNGSAATTSNATTNGNGMSNGKANGELKRSDDHSTKVQVHGKFDSTWEKFRWSLGLWTSTRGVEWIWGIKDLMPVAPENLNRL